MEDVVKKVLSHYINLEYYANGVLEDITSIYNKLVEDCDKIINLQKSYPTKVSYNAAIKLIKEEVNEFTNEMYEILEEEAGVILEQEKEFIKKIYGFEVGTIALSAILFSPINNQDTLKEFVQRTNTNIFRTYDNAMRSGYMFGQSSKDIINQVETNIKQVVNGMDRGVQTAIPSFAKTTDKIVFLKNKVELVYCATLDGRTCLVCGSMHGLKYKSASEAPSLPIHNCCRCVLLPSNLVEEELPTYQQYIDGLSEKEQRHILGKTRYEYYKSGVPVEKFVNNGTKLTLEELAKTLDQ